MIDKSRILIISSLLIIGLVLMHKPVVAEETYSITLEAGCNLVSLPVMPEDAGISSVLSPIITQVTDAWEYDASDAKDPWKHYRPGFETYSDLIRMIPGRGYWIEVNCRITLEVKGEPAAEGLAVQLKKGWNAIGWPYEDSRNITDALSDLAFGTDYTQVSRFNTTKNKQENFVNQSGQDDFSAFEPGYGYYIYMLNDRDISLGKSDNVPPVILLSQPDTPTNNNVYLSYSVSDDVSSASDISVIGNNSPYTAEGGYSVSLTAVDEAGNSAQSNTVSFSIDKTAPVVVITSPSDNTLVNTSQVTLEGTVDGINFSETRRLAEGSNTLTKAATDSAGNTSSASITVALDTEPPLVLITSPADGATVNTPEVTLQGTVDGKAFSQAYTLSEGENTLEKSARDEAGNSSSASITVNLDTAAPEIIITSPLPDSVFTTQEITLEGLVDGEPFSETVILDEVGENIIEKEVTDTAGNTASASVTVIYSPGELIGPEGGEVLSYDGMIKLVIPEGALLEPEHISVESINPNLFSDKFPEDYTSYVGVECEPMGLILQKQAQLIITLDNEEVPGTELSLGLYDYGLDAIELLGQSSPVEKDGLTVIFYLSHFSEYFGLKNLVSQGAPIGSGVQVPLPDLLTGSYSYEVPIVVPPGRAKMQPAVSLRYNSSNSSSWTGYGWNLNPGYIMRSTKKGIPCYDDEQDTFILVNGSSSTELVHLIDNLYQARVESEFSRFYKETDDSWRVVQKDGTSLRFGTGLDSREGSSSKTFAWKLTQVTDNNGNAINLSYTKDEGKSYLSGISYNGGTHIVNFYLEDRDDIISSYISGSKISMRKRLSKIEVHVGYDLAWRYELDYDYAPETNRSLLKAVRRFTSDGNEFPAQEFTYQNHNGELE